MMTPLQRWSVGQERVRIEDIHPVVASWDRAPSPGQQRLKAYLTDVSNRLGSLDPQASPAYLHLDIGFAPEHEHRLSHHYDLENYLTPLVRHLLQTYDLPRNYFTLVRARKSIRNTSFLAIGEAVPLLASSEAPSWQNLQPLHLEGSVGTSAWKEQLRRHVEQGVPQPLSAGPVEMHIGWRCSSHGRNWVNMWKPTGDAMGPILGTPDVRKPFHPYDDRIVALDLHLHDDRTQGFAVDVALWWKLATPEGSAEESYE